MSNTTQDSKINPVTKHCGKVIGFTAKCKCRHKFKEREYQYQAIGDLLDHYREVGSMHDQDEDISADEFLMRDNETRNRAYIR